MVDYSESTQSSQQREKALEVKSEGNQAQSSRHKRTFPNGVTQDVVNSSHGELWHQVWNVFQESSLQTQCPWFLLGAGHIDTPCITHTKILDCQRESMCSDNFNILSYSYPFVFYQRKKQFNIQLPDTSQWCNLHAALLSMAASDLLW